jgi:hypothetical protein
MGYKQRSGARADDERARLIAGPAAPLGFDHALSTMTVREWTMAKAKLAVNASQR